MDHRLLRYFVSVAEDLNITRAALRLGVAQPHLSREIRRLEALIGAPLLDRVHGRVALTVAGRSLLEDARRILAATAEAAVKARRAAAGEIGEVSVGFSSSAGFGLMPDAVRRFRSERPEVRLSLSEFNSDEQVDLLARRTIDVALLYPPRPLSDDVVVETLAVDPLIVALPDAHPLAALDEIPLRALAGEPWIFFPRVIASRLHDEIIRACGEAGFVPRAVQEARKLATIASLVSSGLGLTLVPWTLERLRLPRMVCRPLAAPGASLPLSMIHRRGDANPALDSFMAIVRAEAHPRREGSN